MKLELSPQIFEKYTKAKIHKNLGSGSRLVSCGRTDGRLDGQTGMTKPMVVFRSFAKTSKNPSLPKSTGGTLPMFRSVTHV